MNLDTIFSLLMLFGLPIASMFLQGWLIRRRLPWVGFVAGLLPITVVWTSLMIFFVPLPQDCWRGTNCEWSGIGLLLISAYALAVILLNVLAGLLIQFIFRKWVWGSGAAIRHTGLVPCLVALGALLIILGYSLFIRRGLISGL